MSNPITSPQRHKKRIKQGSFFSLRKKIAIISVIFTGVVMGIWTIKTLNAPLNDMNIPLLTTLDMNPHLFKEAPGQEDIIISPHSDKEFYAELDRDQKKTPPGQLRIKEERPSKQVSQEALLTEKFTEKTPIIEEISKPEKISKIETISSQENISIVETPTALTEIMSYTPQKNSQKAKKFRKTLEMTIQETKKKMRHKTTLNKKVFLKKISLKKKSKGSYWIQVASLSTENAALIESKRLQRKSKKELKSESFRTVRVDLGKPKGVKYRVHFGPYERSTAIQKCKNLKGQERINCLVVKN